MVTDIDTYGVSYLRSPVVELNFGSGDAESTLYAHQGVLIGSPFFAEACAQFSDSASRRRIELQQDDEAATASVLEYLYKGDYFPALQGNTNLEYDQTVPSPDNNGLGLLRHARIYTLAQKFGLPQLAALAHKKIHLTQSTAKGEIAYARFVYKETSVDDESIRKPVAAFWATRSHVLRHEAEYEFKRMCLEFPQFGYDVLSLVLDAQEKRSQRAEGSAAGPAGRKRQRVCLHLKFAVSYHELIYIPDRALSIGPPPCIISFVVVQSATGALYLGSWMYNRHVFTPSLPSTDQGIRIRRLY